MIEEKSKSKLENDEGSVMQRLHAYWRMPYILAQDTEKPAENPFSKMQDSKDDQSNHIIFRGQFNFIVMNRYPYNAGTADSPNPYSAIFVVAQQQLLKRIRNMTQLRNAKIEKDNINE